MKQKSLLKTLFLLLCAMVAGSGSAWGQVASAAPENGKSYVIAAYVNSKYFALPCTTIAGGKINGIEVTLTNSNKVNPKDAEGKTWTLNEGTGSNAGTFYIQYTDGNDTYSLYKNGTGATNYNFAINKTSKNYWSFTANENGGYTVTAIGRGENNTNINCTNNSGTGQFSCRDATSIILLEIDETTTYTVTFDAGEGTFVNNDNFPNLSNTIAAGTYTLPSVTPPIGYTFDGWIATGIDNPITGSYTVSCDVAFLAQYTQSQSGNTVTLTQSNLELTGSYTTNTSKTIDGITYVYTDLMKSNNRIQAKEASGTIKNSTAFPGNINSVAITHDDTARPTTINGSSDGTNWTQVATGSGSITADFSGRGYKYFQITRGSNAAYWTKIEITIAPAPTHTVTFNVNGTTTTATVAEGAAIEFPNNPADINGMKFVGWYTDEYTHATDAPSFVTSATMGDSDVTYYAVFAEEEATEQTVETKTQTLQYDSWTYNGTTADKTTYRLFGEDSYIESASFDLGKLSKVIVYAGTYGSLAADKKKVTVTAGETIWGSATLSTKSATTPNSIISSTSLSGNGSLHIVAGGGDASDNGIRISKVEIFTNEPVFDYSNYCTTVPSPAITLSTNTVGATADGTESTTINVTYTAIETSAGVDFVWYTDETANTAITDDDDEPDWLIPGINSSNNLAFLFDENTGAARTAYMKVRAIDVNGNDVYSELITITQAAATVSVAVTDAGLATFACDNDLDYSNVDGLEAYVATNNNNNNNEVILQQVNVVPAGTGVLLRATDGGDKSYEVSITTATEADRAAISGNMFVRGTGEKVASVVTVNDATMYNYILNKVNNKLGFYKANKQTVATNRAYLQTSVAAKARVDINFGENSGIVTVSRESTASNRYYDLQGRSVMQPTKGLYIVNGKKVVVK